VPPLWGTETPRYVRKSLTEKSETIRFSTYASYDNETSEPFVDLYVYTYNLARNVEDLRQNLR